ncbi:unnamed protein product [Staurois parvus]|uniref:Uncharacterized protein n=1 Tax=Staurois parvus TaxID=386267 RepID=A0ABN9CWB7_9NEOB|nr:unnamed protein product [Staurois parvus]
MFIDNYETLFQALLKATGKTELSWLGRLAAFKMLILPKLLYFFRTIPILIPHSYFSKLDIAFKKYIWNGRKPRIPLSALI